MNVIKKYSSKHDEGAVEVMGIMDNIHAMGQALDAVQSQDSITVDTILDIHKMLCKGTRIEKYGGIVRDEQNWVGGNSCNPFNIGYVPPAPESMARKARICQKELRP